MKKKLAEEYFTFSKKERNAVILLVILIVGIFILPYYLPSNNSIEDEILAAVQQADTANYFSGESHEPAPYSYKKSAARFNSERPATNIQLFNFDPNNLNADGWRKLGLKDRTIQTIANFLSKGGKFRKPDDLKKIYGISAKHAEQLIPYITIERAETRTPEASPGYVRNKSSPVRIIDINKADSIDLIALKGIGPTLAGRIIRFRDRLGGFHSGDQLKEVYGLPDSTRQTIIQQLMFSTAQINKLSINEADIAVLSRHPYIGRQLARLIINFRELHPKFQKAEDLMQIDVFDQEVLNKLRPYLDF
jgi:competence protein ComEA